MVMMKTLCYEEAGQTSYEITLLILNHSFNTKNAYDERLAL